MEKEKFTIITFIDGDCELALINEKGKRVMGGDYYHDKIEAKIDGFFRGLSYAGIKYERVEEEREGSYYDSEYC